MSVNSEQSAPKVKKLTRREFGKKNIGANESKGAYSQINNSIISNPTEKNKDFSSFSQASKDVIKNEGKQWSEVLSDDECSAIKDYTGNFYKNINAVLRKIDREFDEGNLERATLIHNALNRSSIPENCTVYRGSTLSSLGRYSNCNDSELVGKVLYEDGFMSTSLNSSDAFGGEVRYEILVPKGSKGAYVGYLSHAKHYESEVLFDFGQKLKIVDVKRDEFDNRTVVAEILIKE